jgi:hypothetical protein
MDDGPEDTAHGPTICETILLWSLLPATIVVTVWIFAGPERTTVLLYVVFPILIFYLILLFWLFLAVNHRQDFLNHDGFRSVFTACYIAIVLVQLLSLSPPMLYSEFFPTGTFRRRHIGTDNSDPLLHQEQVV